MTKKEAIDLLDNLIGFIEDNHGSDYDEALKIAIGTFRNIEEIREVMSCNADAETKCKMISNILISKPHYFAEREPKEGHWIGIDEEPHEDYECDKCGYVVSTFTANIEPHTEYKYCPNCGAKMEGEVTE